MFMCCCCCSCAFKYRVYLFGASDISNKKEMCFTEVHKGQAKLGDNVKGGRTRVYAVVRE